MGALAFFKRGVVAVLFFCAGWSVVSPVGAVGPDWWSRQKVTLPEQAPEDFAVLNQGQLKQMALSAYNEMKVALPGGAGAEILEFIKTWTQASNDGLRAPMATPDADDYAPVNLGQLKETTCRFYDRLVDAGMVRCRPWGWVDTDDYALVNVGQAKALFSFELDPGADKDGNGLPDLWELAHFNYIGVDPSADADGDGVSNLQEFLDKTDPQDFFNGVSFRLEAVSGDAQEAGAGFPLKDFLVVRTTTPDGRPISNAPVVFELIAGRSGVLFKAGENEGTGGRIFAGRSDAEGLVSVALRTCQAAGFPMVVRVSSGDTNPVLFRCKTQEAAPGSQTEVKVHTSEFSIDGGESTESLQVFLRCGTPGAVVHYTTNGNDPTEEDPVAEEEVYVAVEETLVLKARAFLNGAVASEVRGASFRIGQQIGSRNGQTLALDSSNTLWAWGSNETGALGLGHVEEQMAPAPLQRLGDVASAAVGRSHCLAVLKDGGVVAWGANANDQLASKAFGQSWVPVFVEGLPPVRAVAAGVGHSVALGRDGSVWCWGWNINGQLGNGARTDSSKPLRVRGLSGVCAIAAGDRVTFALCADGSVWAWGSGLLGQLGNGLMLESLRPVKVSGQGGFIAIAAGSDHALALHLDGSVWGWGNNRSGQLGDGVTINRGEPVKVLKLTGKVIAIAAGERYSLALMADHTVMGWGSNDSGELGEQWETFSRPARLRDFDGATWISGGRSANVLFGAKPVNGSNEAPSKQSDKKKKGAGSEVAKEEAEPEGFQIQFGLFADWKSREEVYKMFASLEAYTDVIDEEDPNRTVRRFFGNFSTSLPEVSYSYFLPYGWNNGDMGVTWPVGLEERVDAGLYLGEAATTIQELADRTAFNIEGEAVLEVEITDPDPEKGSRTVPFKSKYSRPGFPELREPDKLFQQTLSDMRRGSTLRFKAPGLASRVFGDYSGDESLVVHLGAFTPQLSVNPINEKYLLFKQGEDGALQFLGKGQGAVLSFSATEKVEYVLCRVMVTQSNYPVTSDSTDFGTMEMRTISSGSSASAIAWIRGAAEMANLEIKLGDGRLAGLSVDWALDIVTERPERKTKDDVHLPVSRNEKAISLPATQAWKIADALKAANKFVGGVCKVNYSIKDTEGKPLMPPAVYDFRIRGKNPRDEEVFSYIHNHPTEIRFAWAMVQHESRQSDGGIPRIFNHFNVAGSNKELPNFSGNPPAEDGWGIAQLDKPLGKSAVTEEVYNWQKNLDKFQKELDQKKQTAKNYMEALRKIYTPSGLWEELQESYVREGTETTLSTLEVAMIQLYNGAAWLVEIKDGKIIYDAPYTSDEFGVLATSRAGGLTRRILRARGGSSGRTETTTCTKSFGMNGRKNYGIRNKQSR